MKKRYTHTPAQRAATRKLLASLGYGSSERALLGCLELLEGTVTEIGIVIAGALLEDSAAQLTGEPHRGKECGPLVRHGRQPGAVYVGGRKARIVRPRVRERGGTEVKIPAYETLSSDEAAGTRMMSAAIAGVSARRYGQAIEDAAEAIGVSKSSVSRRIKQQTAVALDGLMGRVVPRDILAVMIDGIRMGEFIILGAVGIDSAGKKHVLGLADGTTENARVVGDLLTGLKERGLDTQAKILFIIDGAKALRAAIREVCGSHHPIQRCREHKVRNVTDRLPKTKVKDVRAAMRAAWKLTEAEGNARMRKLAQELEVRYPDAARSLMEGLEDTFTVNRLGLPPMLVVSLQSTNAIESSNGTIRSITRRLTHVQNADQALRWAASALLHAEQGFRLIKGNTQIWMLAAALDRTDKATNG